MIDGSLLTEQEVAFLKKQGYRRISNTRRIIAACFKTDKELWELMGTRQAFEHFMNRIEYRRDAWRRDSRNTAKYINVPEELYKLFETAR